MKVTRNASLESVQAMLKTTINWDQQSRDYKLVKTLKYDEFALV